MPCRPPFYPCPGHESISSHDSSAACAFYPVFAGFVRGTFTNSWIARAQTDGFIDGRQRSFKHYADVLHWWETMCQAHHQDGCPPFEPIDFSLDPDAKTHPSSAPCTRIDPNVLVAAGIAIGPSSSSPSSSSVSIASSSSLSSTSSLSASSASSSHSQAKPTPGGSHLFRAGNNVYTVPTAAPSPFGASAPTVKKEPLGSPFRSNKKEEPDSPTLYLNPPGRILTSETRIHLTPSGAARGAQLHAAAAAGHAAAAANAAELAGAGSSAEATPVRIRYSASPSVEVTPLRREAPPPLSVLVTPGPAGDATHPARVHQYALRGVGVFYPTNEAALAAARALGMANPKILFSSNVEKLEAWMMGKPFMGEDS
ncbi:hypothetical protein C8F04DRAFT_1264287 [Mycena alexandri]|uniref:Uncharacterized protein n=1 Tax=Mycena alexandri TaxID=1745969 RepID=A0AAD6WZ59_9AGAR|nr:hypothetical protein C8F04DRAFT_1264287 [Mycena alexandri]